MAKASLTGTCVPFNRCRIAAGAFPHPIESHSAPPALSKRAR